MTIKDFELFHGAVLTKLVRSSKPITLRMIETKTQEAWSVYIINDDVRMFVKYSKNPSDRKKQRDSLIWTFSFAPEHLLQIESIQQQSHQVYVVLVCGQKEVSSDKMCICLIDPDELGKCLDFAKLNDPQNMFVKYSPSKQLRVWGSKNGASSPLTIPTTRLDKWDVLGS